MVTAVRNSNLLRLFWLAAYLSIIIPNLYEAQLECTYFYAEWIYNIKFRRH
jgi:hypothetical protein